MSEDADHLRERIEELKRQVRDHPRDWELFFDAAEECEQLWEALYQIHPAHPLTKPPVRWWHRLLRRKDAS